MPVLNEGELFVFRGYLWLWPWTALRYLSTANPQQPTPWPLENEFACCWAGPRSLAQVKCQLDHWLNIAFVYLSIFSSQTHKCLLAFFLKKEKEEKDSTPKFNVPRALCGRRKKPVHRFIRETTDFESLLSCQANQTLWWWKQTAFILGLWTFPVL